MVAAQNEQNGASGSTVVDVEPPRKLARKKYAVEDREDPSQPVKDPLIYPGVYSPSGIDMMSILVCSSSLWHLYYSSSSLFDCVEHNTSFSLAMRMAFK